MFRKFNLRILLGVLGVLLVVVIAVKLLESRNGNSSFKADRLGFDTTGVSSIVISKGSPVPDIVSLERKDSGWEVKKNQQAYPGSESQVRSLINMLSGLKIESIVAKSKDKWDELQVNDSAGYFVVVKKGDKLLASLVIGKFSWKPSNNPYDRQGKINSYVRMADEETTYSVNSFLQTIVSNDPTVYRDRTILKLEKETIAGLQFTYPDSAFSLARAGENWLLDGVAADSAHTNEHLDNLLRLNGNNFAEGIPAGAKADFSLNVTLSNGQSMLLQAYPTAIADEYILHSGMNPRSYFKPERSMMERIFRGRSWFHAKN